MPVTVKWGKDRFEIELPQNNTPLATIRNLIATYTHLPFHGFSIVHDGAVMKDDNAPSNFFIYCSFITYLLSSICLQPSSKLYDCNNTILFSAITSIFQEYRAGSDIHHSIRASCRVQFPFISTCSVPFRSINTS